MLLKASIIAALSLGLCPSGVFADQGQLSAQAHVELFIGGKKKESVKQYKLDRLKELLEYAIEQSDQNQDIYQSIWTQLIKKRIKGYTDEEISRVFDDFHWPEGFDEGAQAELSYLIQMGQMLQGSDFVPKEMAIDIDLDQIKTITLSSQGAAESFDTSP